MNLLRVWKSLVYPWFPSTSPQGHEKRRKGLLYGSCQHEVLECQREQDRIFWSQFLHPKNPGTFLEMGGDGVIGSHTLGLELHHGWTGALHLSGGKARAQAKELRVCLVLGPEEPDSREKALGLLAIHSPVLNEPIFRMIQAGGLRPNWVIVENREPDPQWCRLLEGLGYGMKFFFHDDEYYQLKGK